MLKELYNLTGELEVSFVSKLIASVDTSIPIWDQYVLKHLGLEKEWSRVNGKAPETRIIVANTIYSRICDLYNDILNSQKGHECINHFRKILPEYNKKISDAKIIDFILAFDCIEKFITIW